MFTVLIVEDNKNTARLMEVVLTQNGYTTLLAENGEEAPVPETETDQVLLDSRQFGQVAPVHAGDDVESIIW